MTARPDTILPTVPPAPAAGPWLLADIGGTNARFAWCLGAGDAPRDLRTLAVDGYQGVAEAAAAYLADCAAAHGAGFEAPRSAAFAVATAVAGDQVAFTNSGWSFSRRAVAAALGLRRLAVLNDFEALALSLPRLSAQQLVAWPGSPPLDGAPHATKAVIGPGTGLGVAGLVPTPAGGWLAVPGEGGHASISTADAFEAELLAAVRREHAHVSAERLLSGIGLPALHAGVAAVLGQPAVAQGAVEIVEQGLSGSCPVCSRTLDAFCALLGSFAGNVALVLGARGGVYVGGGIVPRLGERAFASDFRARFEAKGRFRAYLEAVPTVLITDTLAALAGTAEALAQPGA